MKKNSLRDIGSMMGIPAGKLRRNIKENTVFLNLYSQQIQEAVDNVDIRELLKMSLWEYRRFRDNGTPEERQVSLCCVIYFHSLWINSRCDTRSSNSNYSAAFKTVFRLMKENVKRTSLYIDYSLLLSKSEGEINREQLEVRRRDLYNKVLPREIKINAFIELKKYDDLIQKSLGISSLELEKGFATITEAGLKGIDHLFQELSEFNTVLSLKAEQFKKTHSRMTEEEMFSRIIKENGWEQWNEELAGKRDGFDLYDVEKITDFSPSLCESFSIEPRLMKEKETWLVNSVEYLDYPFVKFNGHYYCFTAILISNYIIDMVKKAVLSKGIFSVEDWEEASRKKSSEYSEENNEELGPDLFDNAIQEDEEEEEEEEGKPGEEAEVISSEESELYSDDDIYEDEPEQVVSDNEEAHSSDLFDEEGQEDAEEVEKLEVKNTDTEIPAEVEDESEEEIVPVHEELLIKKTDIKEDDMTEKKEKSTEDLFINDNGPQSLEDMAVLAGKDKKIFNSLLSLNSNDKKALMNMIEKATDAWKRDNNEKIFAVDQLQLSFIIGHKNSDPMKRLGRNQNLAARMYALGKNEWNIINLIHDGSKRIIEIKTEQVSRKSFSDWEWKAVIRIAKDRFLNK